MAFYLSPLVHVKEIDLSMTIGAVATSIGCIVIRNPIRGPEMKQTLVTTEEELIQIFGRSRNDDLHNYRDMNAAIGFLRYGRNLYVSAVRPESATFAGLKVFSHPTSGQIYEVFDENDVETLELDDFPNYDVDSFADTVMLPEGNDVIFIAKDRGGYGNRYAVGICNKSLYDLIRTVDYFTDNAPDVASPLRELGRDVDGRWVWNSFFNTVRGLDVPMQIGDFLILVLEHELYNDQPILRENFLVSLNENAIDDQGITTFVENVVNQRSQYVRVAINNILKNQEDFPFFTSDWHFLGGGVDSMDTTIIPSHQIIEAYDLYMNPEEIDINLIIDGDKPTEVKHYLADFCSRRMDCMAILDCKYEHVVNNRKNETMTLRNYRLGLAPFENDNLNINTSYAALYGNWIEVYDKHSRKFRWIPASGHVAGIYANTDWTNDPWWAPAGLNRGILDNVRRLAWNPGLGHRDILYKHGINPICSFPGQGKVIWGQKNLLDKSSAFNRINVRRLFIVLEKAISTAAKYYLFEFNDRITRVSLVNMIEPFLRDVKSRRGIYEFAVICDESNNTPERIDRNELWCDIYIQPAKVAEFIVLQFIATKTGVSFTEAAQAVGTM